MYKKSKEKELTPELFHSPTSEYRGAPFWAWNQALDQETLLKHIDYFKEMGMGGFHMHSRTGLDTPYLGEEFMSCVRACVDKAKKRGCMRIYMMKIVGLPAQPVVKLQKTNVSAAVIWCSPPL